MPNDAVDCSREAFVITDELLDRWMASWLTPTETGWGSARHVPKQVEAATAEILKAVKLMEVERITAERDAAVAEAGRLREALRPFARHLGKDGEKVTLSIGKDFWSGTLTTDHFAAARAALEGGAK